MSDRKTPAPPDNFREVGTQARREPREEVHDRGRSDYTAGADGDQEVDASAADTEDPDAAPAKDGTGW